LESTTGGGLAETIERWSSNAAAWIEARPLWVWVLILGGLAALAVALVMSAPRDHDDSQREPVAPG
ncbi:MAG TPA: hypothetical protein VF855_12990, partial [Acidimicrobiales bacterium]